MRHLFVLISMVHAQSITEDNDKAKDNTIILICIIVMVCITFITPIIICICDTRHEDEIVLAIQENESTRIRQENAIVLEIQENDTNELWSIRQENTNELAHIIQENEITLGRQEVINERERARQLIGLDIIPQHTRSRRIKQILAIADPIYCEDKCSICVDDIHDDAIITSCGHYYHMECIAPWLMHNDKCPLCNMDLFK
jgi:hypothetical protein